MPDSDDFLPLAINDEGWLCPNCLEQNYSDHPVKGDILTCYNCSHSTLVE